MTVLDIYVDSSVSGSGTGTRLDPFKTLVLAAAAASSTSGDLNRIHIKSGSTLDEKIPGSLTSAAGVGLYMDVYGGSVKPIIDASTSAPTWTLDGTYGFYTATLGTNDSGDVSGKLTIGALFEDGICLPMRVYNANHTTLASSLTGGGYAYNWDTGIVYMKPTSGSPGSHTYRAATKSYIAWMSVQGPYGLGNLTHMGRLQAGRPSPYSHDGFEWNFLLQGLVLRGAKRHGVLVTKPKALLEDCDFYGHGGQQQATSGATHLGNGLEIAEGCRVLTVDRCLFEQNFDAGASPQTYGSGHFAEDIIIRDSEFVANGLCGIELSVQASTGCSTKNIVVSRNHVRDALDSFAPAIYSGRYRGIQVVFNGTTGVLDNITISQNLIENMQSGASALNSGTGIVVTECGMAVVVEENTIRNCEVSGIYATINTGPASLINFRNNVIEGCGNGIFVNSTVTTGTAVFSNNLISDCDVGFKDTSTANTPVVLSNNVLNATDAVVATRTTGINGSGNTSTGTIPSTHAYLF